METASIFSGNSRFGNDFVQIIDRAVGLATLPLLQLESQKTALIDQRSAVVTLADSFDSLRSAVSDLVLAASNNEFSATVSNSAVLSVTAGSNTLPGDFVVEVVDLGSTTNAVSAEDLNTVSDPTTENISDSAEFELRVEGESFLVKPAGASLLKLAEAINEAGAGVTATVVNFGPSSAPDYRLSVQSQSLGAVSVALFESGEAPPVNNPPGNGNGNGNGGGNGNGNGNGNGGPPPSGGLLETVVEGSPLLYQVAGLSTPIESDSRSVILGPGVTADLVGEGRSEISIKSSPAKLSSGLAAFVSAFNGAVEQLDTHRGIDAGALAGDSVVLSLSYYLRSISSYADREGAISDISDLGLAFDRDGKLSFDASKVSAASGTELQQIRSFLGDASSGGFLTLATNVTGQIGDTSSDGLLGNAVDSLDGQIERQDALILVNQERIQLLIENLEQRMAAADALIASLEQQLTQVSALFEAIREGQESE